MIYSLINPPLKKDQNPLQFKMGLTENLKNWRLSVCVS